MLRNQRYITFIIFTLLLTLSCKTKQPSISVEKQKETQIHSMKALSPIVIYKTKVNLYNNVPVILSEDKKDIVSFPDIKDVYYKGQLAYPTRLENGYLLDNRGINKNVAFLKYTYEEYSKLPETPTKENLLKMVIDKNPLLELYSCEKLNRMNIEELNNSIRQGLPGICKNIINQ